MRRAAAVEDGPGDLKAWEDCGPGSGPQGRNYDPEPDTGGLWDDWKAACRGGTFRSSNLCREPEGHELGWHKVGEEHSECYSVNYNAVSGRCWGGDSSKNAWRWKVPHRDNPDDMVAFRCSDGTKYVNKPCISETNFWDTVCRAKAFK